MLKKNKKRLSALALCLVAALCLGCTACAPQAGTGAAATTQATTTAAAAAGGADATTAAADEATTAAAESGDATSAAAGADAPAAGDLSAPNVFPITQEPSTLRIIMGNTAQVEDFSTNEYTKWYEEKTNVHIEWDMLPVVEGGAKLSLMLSAGEYGDMLMNTRFLSRSQVMAYATQGIIAPIKGLVQEHAPNLTNLFATEDLAYLEDLLTYPDGEMYFLPDVNQCYHCSMHFKMWIYKPWMDKLNLEMPTTIEEYADVLRAFRDNDPNGNGQPDEVPYSTQKDFNPGFLMNSFIYNNNGTSTKLENGQIVTSITKDEWREGLEYMNMLYSEGLIAPETFTQDWDQMKQMGEYPDYAILGSASAMHTGMFSQFYGDSGRWLEYVAIAPLTGPGGRTPTTQFDPYQAAVDTLITDKCANPALAIKWVDGMYENESCMRSIFGRPDVEWTWAADTDIGINGEPALYKLLIPWAETVQNVTWAQAGPHTRTNTFRMGETAKPEEPVETILYEATRLYEPYAPPYTDIVPPLVFSDEVAAELADIEKGVGDYLKQMNASFIMGDTDLETGWDTYLATLESLQLPRMLELHQAAYDAKYK